MNLYFGNINQEIWNILVHPQKRYHRVRNRACTFRLFWSHLLLFPSCREESLSASQNSWDLVDQISYQQDLQLVVVHDAKKCLIESRSLAAFIKLDKSRYTLETVWPPITGTGGKATVGAYCIVVWKGSHESWKMWKLSNLGNLGCTALVFLFFFFSLSWSSFCQRVLFWLILNFSRQLNSMTQGLMTDRDLLMLKKHK